MCATCTICITRSEIDESNHGGMNEENKNRWWNDQVKENHEVRNRRFQDGNTGRCFISRRASETIILSKE